MALAADWPTSAPSMTNLSRQLRPSFMILSSLILLSIGSRASHCDCKLERNIKRESSRRRSKHDLHASLGDELCIQTRTHFLDSAVRSIAGPLDAAKRRSVSAKLLMDIIPAFTAAPIVAAVLADAQPPE